MQGGLADSVSGWVNAAPVERVARDQRLLSLSDAIDAYEAKFGEITADEMAAPARRDREAAVVVRGAVRKSRAGRPAAGGAA